MKDLAEKKPGCKCDIHQCMSWSDEQKYAVLQLSLGKILSLGEEDCRMRKDLSLGGYA
jgi:hypothetical protein